MRPSRAHRRIAMTLGLVALGAGVAAWLGNAPAVGQEADAAAAVAAAVGDMEGARPEAVFSVARELDRLGPDGIEPAKAALAEAKPRARLGLARYLLGQNERKAALDALEDTIKGDDIEAAALAAEMFERYARTRREVSGLSALLDSVREPSVKIAVAKALRVKARDTAAERVLKDYLQSDEYDVRAMAALALGELGNIEAAKSVLTELQEEPTDRGKRAKSLLYQDKLFESLKRSQGLDPENQVKLLEKKVRDLKLELAKAERAAKSGGAEAPAGGAVEEVKGQKLVQELVRKIRRYYVEEGDKIDVKELYDAAAKGLVSSLDPFSSYMTEKETQEFRTSIGQKYAGIGAVVSMDPKDKLLTIIRPIYSGPAYKAGLRSLDKITKVEGESTFGKSVEELVSTLKGDPGTQVTIMVYRKGWRKEREFTLTREEITLKSVHYQMLPGQIGYVALSQFGEQAVKETEDALVDLEARGMKALVFDLRANPGGLLTAAVDIADKFLSDNKLIVYSQGRNPHIAPRREYRTKNATTHPGYPMIVLINKASASASEIVSGALQEHGRAMLVGDTTFGKGTVQQLLKVDTTDKESTLRLTIAKYYLPSGRSIHKDPETKEGGVQPDVVVEQDNRPAWEVEEADRIRETGKLDKYAEKLWKENKALMRDLAVFDGHDPSRYPGFDAFYASLETALPKDQARSLVRGQIRRFAQDDQGAEFPTDLQEDEQLQRAIYEAARKSGVELSDHAEYRPFSKKFVEAPKAPETPGEIR